MWTADKEVNEYQSFLLRKCFRDLLDKRRASKNYNFLPEEQHSGHRKRKDIYFRGYNV